MRFGRIEILLNVLFWGLLTWVFVFGNASMDLQSVEIIAGKKHKTFIPNDAKFQALLIAQLFFLVYFYAELYLIDQLSKPKAVTGFVLKSIGLMLLTFVLYFSLLLFVFNSDVNLGELNLPTIIIFYTAVVMCYGFTKKWTHQEHDKQQLILIKNQTELNLLKQQLHPHFLFNTMNNLLSMVNQSDNPKLARSIDKLSGLLRYVVYDTINKKVTVQKEIEFINNYAELHLLRYEEDEIEFRLHIDGEHNLQEIEPGILLCYVENAFKHGVQPEEKAFIHIDINLSNSDTISFLIENSIPQKAFKPLEGGVGMRANRDRLDLMYPDRYTLSVKKEETYQAHLTIMS